MAVRPKERELAAVGIAVGCGCKPCTEYHVMTAQQLRATDEEIADAIAVGSGLRRHATGIIEAYALDTLHGTSTPDRGSDVGETDRIREMVSVGAAFAVNCVSNLRRHLEQASALGISQAEISEIIRLATFIKGKAASHAEGALAALGSQDASDTLYDYHPPPGV